MSAIKCSFTDALEPVVYWDSSFAIARADRAAPWHNECMNFAASMQAEGMFASLTDDCKFGLRSLRGMKCQRNDEAISYVRAKYEIASVALLLRNDNNKLFRHVLNESGEK